MKCGKNLQRLLQKNIKPAVVRESELLDILAVPQDQIMNFKNNLSMFFAETGSEIAGALLKDWDKSLSRISLVMPRDYARVLAAMERAEREGLPVDELVMEVAANG
jgi:glutamate synthase (NADPH/NADH) large chain